TFGCLNSFTKVTTSTLSTWRNLLCAVPRSRLILHAPAGRSRARIVEFLAVADIDASRIEFIRSLPTEQYMRTYDRIDIALDPFPYPGGTTTCDALWMGVPVVSRAGNTAVSRAGLSLLSNVGLAELVATSDAAYVTIAADLARDIPRLSELRQSMRQRMRNSVLMNTPRFVRHLEAAYREMWKRHLSAAPRPRACR
ncbi:MAG: protein O-GlcNAc transferase, partial [Humisphaera sp.]|nr:protein O-GlcNAc transferase [Humisphaera sp.]